MFSPGREIRIWNSDLEGFDVLKREGVANIFEGGASAGTIVQTERKQDDEPLVDASSSCESKMTCSAACTSQSAASEMILSAKGIRKGRHSRATDCLAQQGFEALTVLVHHLLVRRRPSPPSVAEVEDVDVLIQIPKAARLELRRPDRSNGE